MENRVKTIEFYQIQLENRSDYLYASVKSDENLEGIKSYWKHLSVECRNRDSNKILIEAECKEVVSDASSNKKHRPKLFTVSNMYELGEYIANLDFLGVKIALVIDRPEKQELNTFCELVATNRGLDGKVFYEKDAAEGWLVQAN